MDDPDLKLLIAIIVLIALAAGWYFRDELWPPEPEPVAVEAEPAPVAAEEPVSMAPIHPLDPIEPKTPDGRLVELPPLDDSDAYFLLALGDLFGSEVELVLAKKNLIDRFVATVDNLPRSAVPGKIRVAARLPDSFRADAAGDTEIFYTSPENHRRYDQLFGLVASADLDAVVDTYRRFYPLLQEAYQRLGYPNGYFNDRVVEVIDHLLATPQKSEPIALVRPKVLYEFADPQLEQLSAGQKLLLRMGGEHANTTRTVLRNLRARLVDQ